MTITSAGPRHNNDNADNDNDDDDDDDNDGDVDDDDADDEVDGDALCMSDCDHHISTAETQLLCPLSLRLHTTIDATIHNNT